MESATMWCFVQEERDNKTTTVVARLHVRDVTEEELQGLMQTAAASVSTALWWHDAASHFHLTTLRNAGFFHIIYSPAQDLFPSSLRKS
jgi:hypothetical protein